MHNLIMVTSIDTIVIIVIPGAIPVIDTITGIGIVNLHLAIARSKTIMLMIMDVCDLALALILVPQAVLVTFMVTLMMECDLCSSSRK